jgi:hypothetical protein
LRRWTAAHLALAFALTCVAGVPASAHAAQGEPTATPGGATPPPRTERHALATHPRPRVRSRLPRSNVPSALSDAGFESGSFTYWQQCGNVNASITAARAHAGRYALKSGSSAGEPNGDEGVCQAVTIPPGGKLTFWVYQYATESSTAYAYQEAQLLDAGGATVKQLYQTVNTTNGWVEQSYDVSALAGQTLYLYFGVHGDGYAGAYAIQYVDDVSLTSGSAP